MGQGFFPDNFGVKSRARNDESQEIKASFTGFQAQK